MRHMVHATPVPVGNNCALFNKINTHKRTCYFPKCQTNAVCAAMSE